MTRSLRVVFAGTPQFAVPALEALARSPHSVVAVYAQPDRPAGRGRQIAAGAVKIAAAALGIPVEQPATLKDAAAVATLSGYSPDILVVVAYGLLLPQGILDLPARACVNIHASLLPRWRGAAPIQRALLAGDSLTGISIMRMEAGLDTGPVFAQTSVEIAADETGGSLHDRLAALGAQSLLPVIDAIAADNASAQPQDSSLASYARKIDKREALVDWRLPAAQIERCVRAFNPWPVAETLWRGKQLRIWEAGVVAGMAGALPGTVLRADADGIVVACGEQALALRTLQLPGKRPTAAREFVKAHDLRAARLPSSDGD